MRALALLPREWKLRGTMWSITCASIIMPGREGSQLPAPSTTPEVIAKKPQKQKRRKKVLEPFPEPTTTTRVAQDREAWRRELKCIGFVYYGESRQRFVRLYDWDLSTPRRPDIARDNRLRRGESAGAAS